MTPAPRKKEVVDPLENLTKLVGKIVDFILTYSQIIILIIGVGFLIVILVLLNFFNAIGF